MTEPRHPLALNDPPVRDEGTSDWKPAAVSLMNADSESLYEASLHLARLWRSQLWDDLTNDQAEYTEQCRTDWEELGQSLYRAIIAAGREMSPVSDMNSRV